MTFEATKVVLSFSDNLVAIVALDVGVAKSGIGDAAALVVGREGWWHRG